MRKATAEDARLIREFIGTPESENICYRDMMKCLKLDIPHRSFAQIARNKMFPDPDYSPIPRKRGRVLPTDNGPTCPTRALPDEGYERIILKIPAALYKDIQKIADAFGFVDVRVWYHDAIARHYLEYKGKGFITAATELLSRKDKKDGA